MQPLTSHPSVFHTGGHPPPLFPTPPGGPPVWRLLSTLAAQVARKSKAAVCTLICGSRGSEPRGDDDRPPREGKAEVAAKGDGVWILSLQGRSSRGDDRPPKDEKGRGEQAGRAIMAVFLLAVKAYVFADIWGLERSEDLESPKDCTNLKQRDTLQFGILLKQGNTCRCQLSKVFKSGIDVCCCSAKLPALYTKP